MCKLYLEEILTKYSQKKQIREEKPFLRSKCMFGIITPKVDICFHEKKSIDILLTYTPQ